MGLNGTFPIKCIHSDVRTLQHMMCVQYLQNKIEPAPMAEPSNA